ncbi:MAG: penicillin-binding protein 2, partial [Opitutaceae bacterium]|nr:penicillin-binding protein 2 [Verrucomicrobiales bacterium]
DPAIAEVDLGVADLRAGGGQVGLRGQDVEPRDGLNVVTTLDARIQSIVEMAMAEAFREYGPVNASCVVMRPRTGEILAMSSIPNFDPNRYPDGRPEVFRNRIISDLCEPGSTFKIVVVSAGLHEGTVNLKSPFDCENGLFTYAKRTLHDHEKYGVLSVEQIITKSSNIGAAKIGIQLGEIRLYDYMRRFGFGEVTGIPLPAEARGIIPQVREWSGVTIAQIPMGHGVAVTPLQMVMAMSAIANKGTLMRPMLVKRLEESSGNVVVSWEPRINKQVIGPAAARDMVEALKTVVSKDGTGPKAHLENYTVAGKTGTAQKVENGTYSKTKYFASFIGFFPADEPEICIGVFLDEPKGKGYYGGQVAAPAFQAIAEKLARYLNIRPDIQPEEPGARAITVKLPGPALTFVP